MSIKISVIVPVYNVEKYLDRCLNSIVNQSLTEIEIILVDDGSSDNSPYICDKYEKEYDNISVIHKENQGLGMARNSGLELAKGEYVTFIDSDDYIHSDALKNLYNEAVKNGADTVLGNYCRVDSNNNILEQHAPIENKLFEGKKNIIDNVLKNMLGSPKEYHDDIYLNMAVWMGIYSNKIIRDNHLRFCSEREFISEDIIFDLDYYPLTQKVMITDKIYYYYCENQCSLTTSYKKDRYEKNKILFLEIDRKCKKLNLNVQERLDRSFIGRARQCIYLEASNNNYFRARTNIKKICSDNYLKTKLKRYKNKNMPFKQRIFIFCMRNQLILPVYSASRMFKKYKFN